MSPGLGSQVKLDLEFLFLLLSPAKMLFLFKAVAPTSLLLTVTQFLSSGSSFPFSHQGSLSQGKWHK